MYLGAGINKVMVTGDGGEVTLDKLTVTPVQAAQPDVAIYQAEDGMLTGTAQVSNAYSQADGGVVTGISGGSANSLTFTVRAPAAAPTG